MDAEYEYLCRLLEAVDDGRVMDAMYRQDMCSVLRSQEVVVAAVEISNGDLTAFLSNGSQVGKVADVLRDARERMNANLPWRKDGPRPAVQVSPEFIVEAVKSRRRWSDSDWEGLQANLKRDLSNSAFKSLMAAQEKYHLRDRYVQRGE